MFDFVQKNKRVIQIFLGLIALTFATWGIESYTRMRGGRDTVATVNGLEISAREFDEELRRQQDQLRQALGGRFRPVAVRHPRDAPRRCSTGWCRSAWSPLPRTTRTSP